MAKNKAILFALGGSVVGILGYFLPWITVSIFVERSISGFSLIGMLFGAGSGNILQELGYSANLLIPAILLLLAPIALLFTGVASALMIRSKNVAKTSGILLTIVSGIVFLIVVGIALLISMTIKRQVGSYVDAGSYLSYGVGFVITSLSALVVLISGVISFQNDTQSESDVLGHFGQVEIAHTPELNMSGMDTQGGLPADNLPPISDPGLTQPLQGNSPSPVFAGHQADLQPIQVPPQPQYSKNNGQPWQPPQNQGWAAPATPQIPQQPPYNQTPPQPGQSSQNQGWNSLPSTPPPPGQFRSPSAGQPPQPWQANQNMGWNQQPVQPPHVAPFNPPQPRSASQQPASNINPKQPSQFWQRKSQVQTPLNQANNQPPLDKPWERVQYRGPKKAPQTPQVPPVLPSQETGQGREWIPPYKPPHYGQEDPHTRPDYMTPLEDPEITRYDRDLDKQNTTNDNI